MYREPINTMSLTIDKQLLFEHFANKTTPLQKRRIEQWLIVEKNQELFYAWLVEWENQYAPYSPELEAPLQRFILHMENSPSIRLLNESKSDRANAIVATTPLRSKWSFWGWSAAASLFIGVLLSGWLYKDAIVYETYQTAFGETKSVRLADGSQVSLLASSSLRVPRFGFSKTSREVWLKGEANFNVTHTVDHLKFLVKTDKGFDVVVHGTEFTVNTRSYRANVMLRKGKVQVNCRLGKTRQQIMLKPGDLVALEQPSRPQIQHQVQPQTYTQWKEHRFVFDNMTLQDFGQLLTENYGLSVDIPSQAIARRTLVGSFRAENVDELLQTVAQLFNLTITRQGNTVKLTESE